jgi:hypothetical protein
LPRTVSRKAILAGVWWTSTPNFAFEPAHLHIQVRLAHAVDHEFVRLLVAGDVERGIFLSEPREPRGELVLVAFGGGRDRVCEQRLGELHGLELDGVIFRRPGVPGVGGLQLGDRADVTGRDLGDRLVVLPLLREQLAEPLLRALRGVVDGTVRPDAPAEHAEHRDVTDERIRDGLEHERGGGAGRDRTDAPSLAPFPITVIAPRSSGEGNSSTMKSRSRSIPIVFAADPTNTGARRAAANPAFAPITMCSSGSEPCSRYSSINASSDSATASTSFSRAGSAIAWMSSGHSDSSAIGPLG